MKLGFKRRKIFIKHCYQSTHNESLIFVQKMNSLEEFREHMLCSYHKFFKNIIYLFEKGLDIISNNVLILYQPYLKVKIQVKIEDLT